MKRIFQLRRIFGMSLAVLALLASPLRAQAPDVGRPNDWLRALMAESRLQLGRGTPAAQIRLFQDRLDDGDDWFGFVANELVASGDWPMIDEAASLCLAEAGRMKELAAEHAGTAAEAEYNDARKRLLVAAGRLLKDYGVAAGQVFDEHAAPLLALPDLPDWSLPGEIRLHEIAGAGRINVETLAFSGRLSGLLELPGLETTLAVPNLSFDSRGNIDLLAHGSTAFPPNDPGGVSLTIPERRPLTVHLGEGGDFSVAGGLRVGLPDGNVFEGFFDVDDPDYAFGLAFAGSITLELAKEVVLVKPAFNIDIASSNALLAVDGLAGFFGSFGRGLETFLEDSPEPPSPAELNPGAPPEFEAPETVVPFDVVDAWIVAFANEHVRPLVNDDIERRNAALKKVRGMFDNLQGDIAASRTAEAPTLAQIKRLKRIVRLNDRMRKMLDEAAAAEAAGEESGELLVKVTAAAQEAEQAAREFLQNTPADADFRTGFAAARLYLDAAAGAQMAGGSLLIDTGTVLAKIGDWQANALAGFGYNADGTIADPVRVGSLTQEDFRILALFSINILANKAALGDGGDPAALARIFLRREFEIVRDAYVAAADGDDLETAAVMAMRLLDMRSHHETVDFPATPEELALMLAAWNDTFDAIAARGSGGEIGAKLATSFLEAARNLVEVEDARAARRARALAGETNEDRGQPLPGQPDLMTEGDTFFQRLARVFGGASELEKARTRGNLTTYLEAFAEGNDERFGSIDEVERDLEDSLARLGFMADALAFGEEFLPGEQALLEEFKTSWQALHVKWTPAAEGRKFHWLLAEYMRALAAAGGRYGDGVSVALRSSFATAGAEAGAGLATVIDGLAGIVSGISLDEFKFAMPGDLQIQRLYGELAFNRLSLEWMFKFGGRLMFPDINAVFEIPAAQLASDGLFNMSLLAASDTAFGLNDDFSLSLAVPVFSGRLPFPGQVGNLDAFTGQGTLARRFADGQPQNYQVGVSYTSDLDGDGIGPDGHRFAVTTTFAGQQEFFTPEIMLFTGGFGFNLETDLGGQPTQGGAEVASNVGLLLRPEAVEKAPEQRTAADYFLNFAGEARVDFSVTDQSAEVTLVSGMLTLPEDIFSGPEDTPPTISLLTPVCVRFDLDNPDQPIAWCDVDGNPVRIAFNNIGFKIPGVPDAEATEVATDELIAPEAAAVPGFQAGVSAILLLSGEAFPVIEKINASVSFPFPGEQPDDPDDSNLVNLVIAGENWRVDGLPDSVSIALASPVKLLDLDGFEVEIKANAGEEIAGCPAGLSFVHDPATGETLIRIASAMKVTVDVEMIAGADPNTGAPLAGEAAVLSAEAGGCFMWTIGEFPSFELGDVTFSGRFRLGGSTGIQIKGAGESPLAFVRLQNLTGIFDRGPANPNPFRLSIEGAVNFDDLIEFGLFETAFIWDGTQAIPLSDPPVISNLIPRFEPGGFYAALGEEAIELGSELLPLYPTELGLRFKDSSLPIFPPPGEMGLFDPLNLKVLMSGVVVIPNGSAIEAGSPGIFGSVSGAELQFIAGPGGFPVPDFVATLSSIDKFCLKLENLEIPPLGGISGGICIGNLQALPDNPEELFFLGEAGAKINGMGASVLLAMKPTEFIGAALDLNAGPAGIPLDGGTLGGILLTGAKGGINFKNSFADPTDFASYINDSGPSPVAAFPEPGTTERPGAELDFDDPDYVYDRESPPQDQALPPVPICVAPTQPEFNCIQGPFPPPSINPLAERITLPSGEQRVIYKASALSQAQVDQSLAVIGVSPAQLDGMLPGVAIETFIGAISGEVRAVADAFLEGIPTEGAENQVLEFVELKVEELFDAFDDAARSFLNEAFRKAFKADPNSSIYQIIVAKAAEGIPCFDVTLKLGGTLSHSAISSVLTGSGDVTISSTGTAVLEGRINLVGVPVGDGTLAFALTDESGAINPSFGGVVNVAFGPLELGNMTMALGCRSLDGGSCFDAVIEGLTAWVGNNAATFDSSVSGFMIQMMDTAAPRYDVNGNLIIRSLALRVDAHFVDLTDSEKFAWYSSFLNIFTIVSENAIALAGGAPATELDVLPVDLGTNGGAVIEAFLEDFTGLLVDILTNVNPRICFSADIGPKIFGFPLTGGADSQMAGGLLYERVSDFSDPANPIDYQQLVAQLEFSPSYMLLSPLMGGASFAAPAVDTASMGYSLRMPAFSEDNIRTLLTDPLLFASDQATVLVEDSVLTFGYQLEPLGYKLADGQGRVIFPRIGGHPCNPDRFKRDPVNPEVPIALPAWVSPDVLSAENPAIPTRSEVILAALSKGQLQNPLWRGTSGDLVSLFSQPGTDCYVPGDPGCLVFTQEVTDRITTADPGYTALSGMDFANDFFPHGGFIGGAEIALPNVLAEAPPSAELAELAAFPTSFEDFTDRWLPNAQFLFANPSDLTNPRFGEPGYAYFTGTKCTGQMALYVPAPNPPAAVFGGDNAQDLFDAIKIGNFEDIVNGSAGIYPDGCPVYPAEQMILEGWMNTPVLGLPVAQGLVKYQAESGAFELNASVLGGQPGEPSSWLHEMIGASMMIEIKAPDYLEEAGPFDPANPVVGGSSDRLTGLGGELGSLGQAGVSDFVSAMYGQMPKASAAVDFEFAIPSELDDFLRIPGEVGGEANASLFVFSPFFEPEFGLGAGGQILDPSPYADARRNGGIGVTAAFEFGFFPDGTNIEDQLVFQAAANASLALTPDPDIGVFPAVSGEIGGMATLPGVFSFDGSTPQPFEFAGLLRFKSNPLVNDDFLVVEGALSPIDLGPFLKVTPLPENENPDEMLAGFLAVTRTNGPPAIGLTLDPAAVQVPMLGGLTGRIYGEKIALIDQPDFSDPSHFFFTPFTFSTSPGEEWQATMDLQGDIELRSPFDPIDGPVLFRAEALTEGGASNPFVCEIEGEGLGFFELRLQVPNGVTFTLFPDTPQQSTFETGSNSATCLLINSEGRVYFDSGTRDLRLALPAIDENGGIDRDGNPLAEIRGRIELGFEPVDNTPSIAATPGPLALSAGVGNSITGQVKVSNTNPEASQLVVDASLSDSSHFEITPSRLLLGGGESADIRVRFTPRSGSTKTANLVLEHNGPQPTLSIPLTGTVPTVPKFNITATSINFGATPLATPKSHAVTIANTGTATLSVTSINTSGTGFSDNRSSLNIAPGSSQTITVTFTPVASGAASGSLTMNTNDPSVPGRTITLSGNGSDRFWYRQRKGRGDFVLRDAAFHGETGFAAGGVAGFFRATANGQTWERQVMPGGVDFHATVRTDALLGWLVGTERITKAATVSRAGLILRTTNGGNTWTPVNDTDVTGGGAIGSSLIWNAATRFGGGTEIAVAGEFDGQGRIITQVGPTVFDTSVLNPALIPRLNGIAFSTEQIGVAVGDDLTIMKTVDRGKTWDKITNLPAGLDKGIDLHGVAANPFNTSNFVIVGEGGTILRSADRGDSWTTRVSNTTEDLHAVVRTAGTRFYAVGDAGVILRGSSTGLNPWIVESAETSEDFRGVTASRRDTGTVGGEVWAVTRDGGIFHRQTTAISGPIAVVNIDEPLASSFNGVGEQMIRELRFANEGVADLTVQVSAVGGNANLFEVIEDPYLDPDPDKPGNPISIPPGCEGIHTVIFDHPGTGAFGTTLDITSSDSRIDKLDPVITVTNREPGFSSLGYLTAPGCLDLGTVLVGQSATGGFRTTNIGVADVTIHDTEVRHADPDAIFTVQSKGEGKAIEPRGSDDIIVEFRATEPGVYRGIVEIGSDARNSVIQVEVVARAILAQEVVVVETNVPGSPVLVDYSGIGFPTVFTSPKFFTIVDGAPANNAQIQRGSQVAVSALESFTRDGVRYDFQRWSPGAERAFEFTADGGVRKFTARYAPSRAAGPPVPEPPQATALECGFDRPQDVSFGPWVRITEGRLRLPWLGDAGGSDFQLEGALFISLDRAHGSLTSSAVAAVVPPEFGPPMAGLELVEITPGAWNFDIRSNGLARFRSLTPGLRVLDASVSPPTELDLEIDLNAGDRERRALLRFATLDDLDLLPGVVAVGPGQAELEAALVPDELLFRMDLGGSIQMLANPASPGNWIVSQPVGIAFDAAVGIQPFVFPNTGLVADAGVIRLHSQAGQTSIGPEFDGENLTLAARSFRIDVLRSPEKIVIPEISVDSDGTFDFKAALPSSGLTIGPARIEPQAGGAEAELVVNPLQGLLKLELPGIHLNSSDGLWPNDQVAFAPMSLDSTSFAFRTDLPSIAVDGIGLNGEEEDADNYFEFRRSGTSTSLRLRNRQELFIGGMKVKFNVGGDAGLSGSLGGRLGLEGPPPLNLIQSYASMTYDRNPSADHARFEFNRFYLGIPTRVRFGGINPPAQGCLLNNESPAPIGDWSISISAP